MTPEERAKFDVAKNDALKAFVDTGAWEFFPAEQANPEECCPLRYLLKWKFKNGVFEANARVLFQGFHHKDVLEKNLDKDAPTLSRRGRNFIYCVCAIYC